MVILKNKRIHGSPKVRNNKIKGCSLNKDSHKGGKIMESVCAVARNIPFIVADDKREEFLTLSKDNSGFKRMLKKAEIMQRNKISKIK